MKIKINKKEYDYKDLVLVPKLSPNGFTTWDIVLIKDKKVLDNSVEIIPGIEIKVV